MTVGAGPSGLDQFAHDLHQEVVTDATLDARETMLAEAFTAHVLDILTEVGEWQEAMPCYHRQYGMEVSGWGWDPESGTVDLSVTIFEGGGVQNVPRRNVEAAFARLRGFLAAAVTGLYREVEEASPQFDLAYFIAANLNGFSRVRLFLLTDGITNARPPADETVAGVPCIYHIWDLARIHRVVSSGSKRETIDIDLTERYGTALPCLPAPTKSADFESYLLVVPGEILADLYNEFGPRLLELNVRSFLQARGKVNRGIRDTIITEPDRFFAYNNGISATASAVQVTHANDGTAQLTRIVDLQIVNGGQTTASIANTVRKDKKPVDHIFVQAKLTVVPRDQVADLVPLISRYANSQNRVSEADLSANHRFHVAIEELSRTVWAPTPQGGSRETRWFYERARGQYQDAINREKTPVRMRAFREIHPVRQKFAKTDLAKFENTWAQKPHIVSRGAQKSFVEFMVEINSHPGFVPDKQYFERACAKAMLFRTAERIVSKLEFGGYRANIVAFTLALISHKTGMRVDLDRIWRQQVIGPGLTEAIESLATPVHNFIVNPPGGQNVTEWCKKEASWKQLRDMDFVLPKSLESECIGGKRPSPRSPERPAVVAATEEEQAEVDWTLTVRAETWFGISKWSKDTGQLQPWQRSLSFSIGRLRNSDRAPSVKQARQGRILYDRAVELGYHEQAARRRSST